MAKSAGVLIQELIDAERAELDLLSSGSIAAEYARVRIEAFEEALSAVRGR